MKVYRELVWSPTPTIKKLSIDFIYIYIYIYTVLNGLFYNEQPNINYKF